MLAIFGDKKLYNFKEKYSGKLKKHTATLSIMDKLAL